METTPYRTQGTAVPVTTHTTPLSSQQQQLQRDVPVQGRRVSQLSGEQPAASQPPPAARFPPPFPPSRVSPSTFADSSLCVYLFVRPSLGARLRDALHMGGGHQEGKEIADAGEQMIGSVKKQAEHVYHAACDACHNVSGGRRRGGERKRETGRESVAVSWREAG